MKPRKIKAVTPQDRAIGERIREARIAGGMSQKELGGLLGVSYQQVQKYENGKNGVRGGRIEGLVTALNRPINYFFPNATDVRVTAEPEVRQFISTQDGHWVASNWFLMSHEARGTVRKLIAHLAATGDVKNG